MILSTCALCSDIQHLRFFFFLILYVLFLGLAIDFCPILLEETCPNPFSCPFQNKLFFLVLEIYVLTPTHKLYSVADDATKYRYRLVINLVIENAFMSQLASCIPLLMML